MEINRQRSVRCGWPQFLYNGSNAARCQNPTELLLPDPCSPKGLQTTGTAPKGPDPAPRGTSYTTVFPELCLQPRVSSGRGRFEPQHRGQACGASLVSTAISPLTYWEQKQMSTQLILRAARSAWVKVRASSRLKGGRGRKGKGKQSHGCVTCVPSCPWE